MPPLQQATFDKRSFSEEPGLADFNQQWSFVIQALNQLLGNQGPTPLANHLNMTGHRVTGVADPQDPGDAVTLGYAQNNFGPSAVQPSLEILGQQIMQSMRRLNDPTQRELFSSFLNSLMSTGPSTNTSTVTFGSVSSGSIPVTISAGIFKQLDGTTVGYSAFNDTIGLPGSGTDYFYYFLNKGVTTLRRDGPYTSDAWQNRLNASRDGGTILAVVAVNSSGGDSVHSAAGGTDPVVTNSGVHLFGRL